MKTKAQIEVTCRESATVRLSEQDIDKLRELLLKGIERVVAAESATVPANDAARAAA